MLLTLVKSNLTDKCFFHNKFIVRNFLLDSRIVPRIKWLLVGFPMKLFLMENAREGLYFYEAA